MRIRASLVVYCVSFALLLNFATLDIGVQAETNWTKYAGNPILVNGSVYAWDWFIVHPNVLQVPMGYNMWFTAQTMTGPGEVRLRIGLATAPDKVTWTKHPANPVMDAGPMGSWEEVGVAVPWVIWNGTGYWMWYTGYDSSFSTEIGLATSPDGLNWNKYAGNPVLRPGAIAEWDGGGTGAASVIFEGGLYHAWYMGLDTSDVSRIGYATSPDGRIWTKNPTNPVLDIGGPGEWDSQSIGLPCVLFDGVTYHMWYSGLDGTGIYRVGYATSLDGIIWMKYGGNPVLEEGLPGEWDENGPMGSSVLFAPGGYDLWYGSMDRGGNTAFGYANSTAAINHFPVLVGGEVTPPAGMVNDTFTYNVTYKDEDNDPAAYVNVWINKSGLPVGSSPYNMTLDTWVGAPDDWVEGANFIFSINLTAEGTNYTFAFEASDGEDVTSLPERAGPLVSVPFAPPENTTASLSGPGFADVRIEWSKSPDDTGMGSPVKRYDVLYETTLEKEGVGYSLLGSVAASGLASYSYNHIAGGEGDSSNYFYLVCAMNAVNVSSCASEQTGKFTRPLSQGPNLVSIPLIQSNESIETVLQTVNYDKAWFYDSFSEDWKSYMTSKSYGKGLWNANHMMGLWVNVAGSSNLTVAGVVPAQTEIHLYNGWNLVSFPSFNTTYAVSDLIADTGTTRVEGYDPVSPYCLKVLGPAEVLETGFAYWVKVDADTVWTVEVA